MMKNDKAIYDAFFDLGHKHGFHFETDSRFQNFSGCITDFDLNTFEECLSYMEMIIDR